MDAQVAIIGAGPIGLEMAVALKRAGVAYLHFDAKQIGYTISWFAPGTRFFSSNERIAIAGVPLQTADQSKSAREEYLRYLRTVVELYDLQVRTYEPVVGIEPRDGGGFTLRTRRGNSILEHSVGRIILATGGTDRPRRLGAAGEDLPHVHKYFQDPHTYFRKRLLIVGGRNSAVEAALRCHHAGAQVAISYRRGELDGQSIKYWLLPEIKILIESGRIKGHFQTTVERIEEGRVILRSAAGGQVEVAADFVLPMIGYEADMSLCRMAGITLAGECSIPVFDERTMESDVPGIYLAGTVVGGTQEKYRLFIENCHVHVERIMGALQGKRSVLAEPVFERPES